MDVAGAAPRTGFRGIDVVVPVHNEERDLDPSVRRLRAVLDGCTLRSTVSVADNASSDDTQLIGMRLARELGHVRYRRLEDRGRGRALRAAWMSSDADIVAYMDVDLILRTVLRARFRDA